MIADVGFDTAENGPSSLGSAPDPHPAFRPPMGHINSSEARPLGIWRAHARAWERVAASKHTGLVLDRSRSDDVYPNYSSFIQQLFSWFATCNELTFPNNDRRSAATLWLFRSKTFVKFAFGSPHEIAGPRDFEMRGQYTIACTFCRVSFVVKPVISN